MNAPVKTNSHLMFWHGSQRWEGPAQIRKSRPGCYENGPGLYLTPDLSSASRYAKGAGKLVLFELSHDVTFLENSHLSFDEIKEALESLPRLKNRTRVFEDLERCRDRTIREDRKLSAAILVNICVNNEAISGESGPALALWLSQRGIDASLTKVHGSECLVLFNTKKVLKATPMTSKQAYEIGDFEGMKTQQSTVLLERNPPSPASSFKPPRMG